MADLVQKQLVARIDRRTTVICLHAAGQIQPVSEPFETIAGDYDRPPFHVHCRSIVTMWMPGFVNRYRKDANAELVQRPLSQRRLADGRIPSRIPKPPDPFGGVRAGSPVSPPLGSGGLLHPDEDVLNWVRQDLRTLDDLAGTYDVKTVIDSVPERFTVVGNGGGMSETYWVTDVRTGARYSLKRGSRNSGSLVEVVSTDLQERLGLRLSRSWFADEVGENTWTLTRHIEDVRPGAKVIGSGHTPAQMAKAVGKLDDPASVVDTVLNDFLLDQTDRKSGNWLRLKVGSKEEWVPIDHDGTFLGHAGLGKQDLSFRTRADISSLEEYLAKTGTPPRGFVDAAREVDDASVIARYDDMLARADKIDIWSVLDQYRGVSKQMDARLDDIGLLWESRVTALRDARIENLRFLGAKEVPVSTVVRSTRVDTIGLADWERKIDPIWKTMESSNQEFVRVWRQAVDEGRLRLPLSRAELGLDDLIGGIGKISDVDLRDRASRWTLWDDIDALKATIGSGGEVRLTFKGRGFVTRITAPLDDASVGRLLAVVDDDHAFAQEYLRGLVDVWGHEADFLDEMIDLQQIRWTKAMQDAQERLLAARWAEYDAARALPPSRRPEGIVKKLTGNAGQKLRYIRHETREYIRALERNLLGDVARLFSTPPMEVRMGTSGRAWHRRGVIQLYKNSSSTKTIVHETGHELEDLLPGDLHAELQAWLRRRVEGTQVRHLTDMIPGSSYDSWESAYDDSFFDPYVGKKYKNGFEDPTNRSSEVIAMGVQEMFRSRLGHIEFGKTWNDPEHFFAVLRMMGWDPGGL